MNSKCEFSKVHKKGGLPKQCVCPGDSGEEWSAERAEGSREQVSVQERLGLMMRARGLRD